MDGVTLSPSRSGVDLRYVLTRQRTARVRPRQTTDESPPRVLVSPALGELAGGTGGSLPLQVGGALVTVRVAGTVTRFPATSGEIVVGDRAALRTAVNAAAPGAARENEVWLDVSDGQSATIRGRLARPPFDVLAVTSRADLEEEARRDPLAHGTLLALGAAALLALILAALGLALAVRSELRDERSELYELEAQGASPSVLRRVVRTRAIAISVAGLAAGALTGIVLVALVTRVVSVTARGGVAEPPLVATVDMLVVGAGVAAYAVVAAVLVGFATRRSFAEARGPARGAR
jgi:predicted lysophospholipase L1 biosynthesis ABC-type transport system permease subunit